MLRGVFLIEDTQTPDYCPSARVCAKDRVEEKYETAPVYSPEGWREWKPL